MKKMIFFTIISIFSNNLFASKCSDGFEWAQEEDFFLKINHKNEEVSDASDTEDQLYSKKIKIKSKRIFTLEKSDDKKRSLSLEKKRRHKSIEQNEIILNHREMVAFMMCCSHEKYN